jgi:hypothetical protein
MFKQTRRLVPLCFINLCIVMSIGHAGGKSDAPLLYYYSTIENAFVIERGDGSEQRTLTEFTIPQDCYAYDYCDFRLNKQQLTLLIERGTND